MRDFIGEGIHIDGRMIPYQLITAHDYFEAKGLSEQESDDLYETNVGPLVTQIMALKQSCYLLRHTSYSCQSLSDQLHSLKMRLIYELKDKHSFVFDDSFVETYGNVKKR